MTAPKVTTSRLQQAGRVASFPGVGIGIVIPATKGPVGEATLITDEGQFLRQFTPNERVDVGMDLAYYSAIAALTAANRLWVARAHNESVIGGYVLCSYAPSWQADTVYEIGDRVLPTTPNGFVYEATVGGTSDSSEPTFPPAIGDTVDDGGVTWENVSAREGAGYPIPVGYADMADYDFGASASAWEAETSYTEGVKVVPTTQTGFYYRAGGDGTSDASEPTWPTAIGETVVDNDITWTCEGTINDDAVLLHGANPGDWNNNIGVRVFNFEESASEVQEPDAFLLRIFRGSEQVEAQFNGGILLSRDSSAKDGFGRNLFVEDKLETSNHLRAKSNPAIGSSTTVAEIGTTDRLEQGDDGSAVTDTQMESAADLLASKADVSPLTLLIDGGWATESFASKLTTIASDRRDCEAILSVPFDQENVSEPATSIEEYRTDTLALDTAWGALFSPHVKIRDKFNDRDIFTSPDGYMAAAISRTAAAFDLWVAAAGTREEARIPVADLLHRFDEGQTDQLYDAGVNPIIFREGGGIRPWGYRTLQNAPGPLQELNVQFLLIVIEPALKEFMESFLFKINNAANRSLAVARIDSYLRSIVNRSIPGLVEGIDGGEPFDVRADETNNTGSDISNGIMRVWVFLRSARLTTEIPITLILTNPGGEFSLGAN